MMYYYVVVVDKKTNVVKGFYNGCGFTTVRSDAIAFSDKFIAEANAKTHKTSIYNVGVLGEKKNGKDH